MKKLLTGFFCFFILSGFAQIGSWQDHLSHIQTKEIIYNGENYILASDNGLLIYDRVTGELEVLSKINGLNDVKVEAIAYAPNQNSLLVGYQNSNIDLIRDNQIINLPDILNSSLLGKKTINDIYVRGDLAYIGCGFGIVVLDIPRQEIKETYFIGPNATQVNVRALTTTSTQIIAATDQGMFTAELSNPNLIDFNAWTQHSVGGKGSFNTLTTLDDVVYTNLDAPDFNQDTVFTYDGNAWTRFGNFTWSTNKLKAINGELYACHYSSMVRYRTDGGVEKILNQTPYPSFRPQDVVVDEFGHNWIADEENALIHNWFGINFENIKPNTPSNSGSFGVSAHDGIVSIAGGSIDLSWNNEFSTSGVHILNQGQWKSYPSEQLDGARDIIRTKINPNSKKVYAASWNQGLLELNPQGLLERYEDSNSSLQTRPNDNLNYVRIGGMDWDEENRLWVLNSEVNEPLSVRKTDGTWQSFSLSPKVSADQLSQVLVVDHNGYKWFTLRREGIVVFNDNGTLNNTGDDEIKRLTHIEGNGGLPTEEVLCMAEDLDGEMWVGTSEGVAVFYNTEFLFDPNNSNFDAQPILVQLDGSVNKLLDEERVTAIAIDGSNRKWFGTASGGVFYFSADGTQEIFHFTKENSPLVSNTILDIAIDGETGIVYFATDAGLVSYLSAAIAPEEEMTQVYAFPNPVRPDHEGPIAITGLVRDANVKITDINGQLVYETTSDGGRAIWPGTNLNGEAIHSGVYLVFITNFDGSKSLVTKIAVVK